ncbi:hypothetical protein MUJ63_11035 [Lachnospiraceae bacterium NSJ-143]|nr:hypothetical protein [Lachnospiraceae bacterium NSJ-143]
MRNLNEKAAKIFDNEMWYICAGKKPESSVVLFKEVTTDGRLVFPVFGCEGVISNMSESNKIAVSAADSRTMSGYQVKGRAELLTDGLLADKWKESMQKMFGVDFKFKGIVEVIPDRVIITTPGKHNNEEI